MAILLEASHCAPKQQPRVTTPAQASATDSSASTSTATSTPLDQTATTTQTSELLVYDARIENVGIRDGLFQQLSWTADQEADFVEWSACPLKLGNCATFQSVVNQAILSNFQPGAYQFSLRACIYQNNLPHCGDTLKLTGTITKNLTLSEQSQLLDWVRKNNQINEFMKQLTNLRAEVDRGIQSCIDHHASKIPENQQAATALKDDIQKLINQLKTSIRSVPNSSNTSPGTSTSTLVQIKPVTLPTNPPGGSKRYKPGGLSLVGSDLSCHIVDDLRPGLERIKAAVDAL